MSHLKKLLWAAYVAGFNIGRNDGPAIRLRELFEEWWADYTAMCTTEDVRAEFERTHSGRKEAPNA